MSKLLTRPENDFSPLREAVTVAKQKRDGAAEKFEHYAAKVRHLEAEESILPLDEAAVRSHADELAIATRMRQAAERMLASAETEWELAQNALADAERVRARETDIAILKEKVAFVEREYPKVLDLLAKVQAAIADGDAAASRANAAAIDGEPRVAPVESRLERVPVRPREIIEEVTRELWGYADEREPLPEELWRSVVSAGDGRTGMIDHGSVSDSLGFTAMRNLTRGLVKRPFVVTRYKDADHIYVIDSIATSNLPPLRIHCADTRLVKTSYKLVNPT